MSDDRLSPHLDGTGGGFGKYKGMTVRQMSEQFEQIAEDASMRSFTAVIRISREQVEARGALGLYLYMALGCGIVGAICLVACLVVPQKMHDLFLKIGLACATMTVAFGFGTLSSREHTKAALAQERAIRDLTVDALVKIAAMPGFKAKPLDFTQRKYLLEVLKRTKRTEPSLTAILDMPEA